MEGGNVSITRSTSVAQTDCEQKIEDDNMSITRSISVADYRVIH